MSVCALPERTLGRDAGEVPRKPQRRCAQCRALLPLDAGQGRRYCDPVCRSRHWRRLQRHNEIYRRAVYAGLQVIQGEILCHRAGARSAEYPCRSASERIRCTARRSAEPGHGGCAATLPSRRRDASERPLPYPSPCDGYPSREGACWREGLARAPLGLPAGCGPVQSGPGPHPTPSRPGLDPL